MNTIDVFIERVLSEPKQVITDELCCWETTVLTNCYGCKKQKTFRAVSKSEILKYKKGYSWSE